MTTKTKRQSRVPYALQPSLERRGAPLLRCIPFAFAAGRGLDARDTLTLTLSHEGREDPPFALGAWRRMANSLAADAG